MPRHLLDGLLAVGVKVGPTGVADQQGVAGEDHPGLLAAAVIGDQVGVVGGRVARGGDRLDHRVAELDLLAVRER